METILEGIRAALDLLWSLDAELIEIVFLSLRVSGLATVAAILIGLPLAVVIALTRFPGRRLLITLLQTSMAVPTVVIGLFIYALLSNRGPLGGLGILYTPTAMVIGQCLLALPIVLSLGVAAVGSLESTVYPTLITLGASRPRAVLTLISEARFGLAACVAMAFARVFSEVGISMMAGGNIRGLTRNITTGIAFETGRGEFALGIALGVILLLVALVTNLAIQLVQSQGRNR
ncbi:MAG: ABC transporter permease [Bradymonadales bacterium]|nr:ABC transporter permease [Bradymonadales bacterium]